MASGDDITYRHDKAAHVLGIRAITIRSGTKLDITMAAPATAPMLPDSAQNTVNLKRQSFP
jgi:hypothetical protein